MQSYTFILRTFRLLREHRPGKLVLIFILTLLQGVTSGFSIVLLIPLLQLLSIGGSGEPEGAALFIRSIADKAGIELTIGSVLLIFMVLLILTALLQYLKTVTDARYQQTFIYALRRRLFRKIIMADWRMINSRSKTNHLQILTKEVPNLAYYYFYYLRLLTTLIMAATYILYALLLSPGFTLVIIAVGMTLFIFLRKYLFTSFHLGEMYVDSYNRLLKNIDDFWQSVKIAKVHSSEEFYYSRFDEASASLLDLEFRMQRNWSLPQLIQRIAGLLVLIGVVWVGYRLGTIPMASFVILILLYSRIFPQFTALNNDISVILSNAASVRMVMNLDEELPDPVMNTERSVQPAVLTGEIRLDKISFSYSDGEKLFVDFSAVIKANSITGIIGESGRGKTTLIDMIAGLQSPDSGRIFIDGRPLDEGMLPGWKGGIGYLPQDPFFIDGTLRENLVWDSSGNISDTEIMKVLEQVNAVHLIARFAAGLDEYVVNYPFRFSGGECQRLALARVLLRKPSLLLLDEATSSLDAENEAQIMEVITKLKEKVTVLFVTHRASLLPWFDRV
ncbi:MAG: ABC transporter ATP-binding protein, partial [Bacteroidia bacterium]